MSVTVMSLVWASDLNPNHRLVLLAYADHADDDGHNVYPGEDRMVSKTGYSPGTIRRITRELIQSGYLSQSKRGYRGQRAEFVVNLNRLKGAHPDTLFDLKGAQPDTERRANETGKARAGDTPNHQEPSQPSEDNQHQQLVQAIAEWMTGTKTPTLPKGEWQRIGKAAAELVDIGATPRDVKQRGDLWWKNITKSPQGLVNNWSQLQTQGHEHQWQTNGPWGTLCVECGARREESA